MVLHLVVLLILYGRFLFSAEFRAGMVKQEVAGY